MSPPDDPTTALSSCSATRLLVHTHIIHAHRLWEDRRRIRTAGPVPTDRNVQNDEERMIVHPPPRQILRADGFVQRVVHVPSNRVRVPLYGNDVKAVCEDANTQLKRAGDALGSAVTSS